MKVRRGKVLVVTEEPAGLWAARRDELHIGDHVHFLVRPFLCKPTFNDWHAFIIHISRLIAKHGYTLVILDTLGNLWPVMKENDASEVQAALMPLRRLTDAGAWDPYCSSPSQVRWPRGDSSPWFRHLAGFVDTIIELRRFNALDRDDRRRVLSGFGRYIETPSELVVELAEDRQSYTSHGDKKEAGQHERRVIIDGLLPSEPPGFTAEEVYDNWPKEQKPGKRTIAIDLKTGTATRWKVGGTGKKGRPV